MKLFNMVIPATAAVLLAFAASAGTTRIPVSPVMGTANTRTAVAPPLKWMAPGYPRALASTLPFRDLPVSRISALHAKNGRGGVKLSQIGIARSTSTEATRKALRPLRWVELSNGGAVARIVVRSPDALGLRLGLQLDALPRQAELRFAGSDDPERVVAVVKGLQAMRLADSQSVYWTPGTDGDSQIIEVHVPKGVATSAVRLHVPQLSHLVTNSKNDFILVKGLGDSGSCNVDTACRIPALGQHFVNAKNSVARMTFVKSGGTFFCTGTLLNDTNASTLVPYFYSAHHCISDAATANTVNTYWTFEASSCGSGVSSPFTLRAGGATYLYSSNADAGGTDALLLRLNEAPPPGAFFAGWDPAPVPTATAVNAIHHPAGDLKKSSLGQQINLTSTNISVGWLSGTTEQGSSGSGLFTNTSGAYLLRGGLFEGSASCANTGSLVDTSNRDRYSRFDLAFPSISQYLAPGTGNPAPVAGFNVAVSGLTANFADTSTDSNGSIVARSWNFGDGTTSAATNPARTYAVAGTYTVQLTVTDNGGATASTSRSISVGTSASALGNGVALTGLSGTDGSERRYTMSVPAGATDLVFTTSGGTGDVDLFVSYEALPTDANSLCASESGSNDEVCTFPLPQPGTYHILLHGFSAYSGVTLLGRYTPSPTRQRTRHDFNGDGLSDILWRNSNTGANTIWRSGSAATQQAMVGVTNQSWKIVGVGHFNGDGIDDVLWRNSSSGANIIWKSANATTTQAMTTVTDQAWNVVGTGDFNGDGKDDILWRNSRTGANTIWRSGNAATLQTMVSVPDQAWVVVGVGDFNADGNDDILWRNGRTGANYIWRSGSAATSQAITTVTSLAWEIVGVGDFNGDGIDDVLWRNSSSGANVIWKSANASTPQSMTTVTALTWKIVDVGDFNGDGKDDVLWRNSSTGANTIWRSGNAATLQAVSTVTDQAWVVSPPR